MKVFISWSGTKSHKVALALKDWLPKVIQSLEPYVSSENIDKGARWSTDIATELETSNFGILCVTRDNFEAPWLLFEAGALSKSINKSYVTPFFFDIKGSEITKSPILQFQATVYQKEDIKKLLITINSICDDTHITDDQLNETFDVWYPKLETALDSIKELEAAPQINEEAVDEDNHQAKVLEEILSVVRTNQVILKNPDSNIDTKLNDFQLAIKQQLSRATRIAEIERPYTINRMHPKMVYELLNSSRECEYGFEIVLSLFKANFPWIYEAGMRLLTTLNNRVTDTTKHKAIKKFINIAEFTFRHPMMMEMYESKHNMMDMYEIIRILIDSLHQRYLL